MPHIAWFSIQVPEYPTGSSTYTAQCTLGESVLKRALVSNPLSLSYKC